MQKILTKEEKEAKERKSKVIVSLVLAGIMLLSTLGYAFFQTEKQEYKKLEYKNTEFILGEDSLWHWNTDKYSLSSAYTPNDVENISAPYLDLLNYNRAILYFSHDSDRQAVSEISRNMMQIVERMQFACIGNCSEDYPAKDCNNDNIISIKEGGESLIKRENKCIFITAKQGEVLKAVDAFIFSLFGLQ